MITEIESGKVDTWLCRNYGVTMSAAQADAFCARRYSAANQKDTYGIQFSRCRRCTFGATAYRRAKSKGAFEPDQKKTLVRCKNRW